jgi:hypothetical protein
MVVHDVAKSRGRAWVIIVLAGFAGLIPAACSGVDHRSGPTATVATTATETDPGPVEVPKPSIANGPAGSALTTFRLPGSSWVVQVPAAWASTFDHGGASFTDGTSVITVSSSPLAHSLTEAEVRSAPERITGSTNVGGLVVASRSEPSGPALEVSWTSASEDHDVFLFWTRGVQVQVGLVRSTETSVPRVWEAVPPSFSVDG